MTDLLSVTEAAAARNMSPRLLRHYLAQGRVRGAVRVGHQWTVPPDFKIDPPARPVGRPRKGASDAD